MTATERAPGQARISFASTEICSEAQEAAVRVLRSGWVTTGPEVLEFEREFARLVDADHAVAVASCTAALAISLEALRLPPNSKVLTPTMTFCGAVQAIMDADLRPILVDADPVTMMPDEKTTQAAATAARGADAMVVLHFAGNPAPVPELAHAAGLPLVRVVEDAAHALGTNVGEQSVGAISAATCFSFYATKNLPIGEGGMITTDDPELAERGRVARLHGMSRDAWRRYLPGGDWRYSVDSRGHKANMTDLQAAIGRAQLRRLSEWQDRRAMLASRYDDLLSTIDGIALPPRPGVGRHAWHLYVIQVKDGFGTGRDELMAGLAERGVDCSVHFVPVHQHPYFRRALGADLRPMPQADATAARVLSLPFHPALSEEDVDTVCDAIADVQRQAHRTARRARFNGKHARWRTALRSREVLRTVIVGAGEAGRSMAKDLRSVPEFGLHPVGFLDDGPSVGELVDGLPVLGSLADLTPVAESHDVEAVIVAIPSLGSGMIRDLSRQARAAGVVVRYLPSFIAALERDVRVSDLQQLRVDLLLGRDEIHLVRQASRTVVAGRRVLVTGAGGSIGSELCRQISAFGPAALYLLDHDESNLHRVQLELEGAALLQSDALIIADIRDRRRIVGLFDQLRPEVVFHAAAHKHLPLLERFPCEGVKSNAMGTQHLVRAARASGAKSFVLISTDKAADPTSVLGATKRLAEMIVAEHAAGPMACASVRFGNVLGSRGSFLSVLAAQIGANQPVTVTHPDVTRYFMTVQEAVGLVIEAAGMMSASGETFVLDMGDPVKIVDLVGSYISQLNLDEKQVQVCFTGLRPGEKLNESLFSAGELRHPTTHPRVWSTATPRLGPEALFELQRLYAAAGREDAEGVRASLQRLVPEYRGAPVHAAPAATSAAPYPDDF